MLLSLSRFNGKNAAAAAAADDDDDDDEEDDELMISFLLFPSVST